MSAKITKKISIGLLVLLLSGSMAYWWRYTLSPKSPKLAPTESNWLISIDLREIENALLWDFLYHPFSYWDTSEDTDDKDKDDKKTPSKDLALPSQLLLFQQKGLPNIVFSMPIKIKNSFSTYMDTMVVRKEIELVDRQLTYDTQKHLFYFWDDHQVGIAFAKKDQATIVKKTINNLFTGKNLKPLPTDFAQALSNKKHHIVFWRKPDDLTNQKPTILTGDFNDGYFALAGDIPFKYTFQEKNQTTEFPEKSILDFWAKIDLQNQNFPLTDSFKSSFHRITNVGIDSLKQFWTGDITLCVPSIQAKVDTIITYEYDDDFNKIKKTTTQNIIEPSIFVLLQTTQDSALFTYFQRHNIIKEVDDKNRFVGIPFAKMHAQTQEKKLLIQTKNAHPTLKPKPTSSFLSLSLNCTSYPKMFDYLPFHLDDKHKKLLQTITIDCRQLPHSTIHVQSRIQLKNTSRNILGTLATAKEE